jgi:hypothetical protein
LSNALDNKPTSGDNDGNHGNRVGWFDPWGKPQPEFTVHVIDQTTLATVVAAAEQQRLREEAELVAMVGDSCTLTRDPRPVTRDP